MHVSVKQSKNKSRNFNDKRHRPRWPCFLLSDSTLTRFVVLKDTQLAIIWGGAFTRKEEEDKISPPNPITSLSSGPIESKPGLGVLGGPQGKIRKGLEEIILD